MENVLKTYDPIPWRCSDIINALQISETPILSINPNINSDMFISVSTDSRTITKDELFVALKGDHFDGHNFIFALIRQGVRGFVVERGFYNTLTPEQQREINQHNIFKDYAANNYKSDNRDTKNNICLFPVDDTLAALGMLARFQRIRSGVKVVAITGSNGKTTTRGMTASIFGQHFTTLSTQGNLNNEIGVPLTLLKLAKEHEWAVIEMGMNHHGEISRLSKIACPDIAIITNTTDAHLEGVGTVEDVARAKSEITDGMNKGGTIIINLDDPRRQIIHNKAKENPNICNKIFFGVTPTNRLFESEKLVEPHIDNQERDNIYFSAKNSTFNLNNISFSLCINSKQGEQYYDNLKIGTPAPFMLQNALAASAAAFAADIPENAIRKGLLMFEPAAGRMKIIGFGKHLYRHWLHLIDDTYNANPGSVKAALQTLKNLSKGQESIVVLGDMLELGEQSPHLHFKIGQAVAKAGVKRLYAHGDMASEIVRGAQIEGFSHENILYGSKEEIVDNILKSLKATAKTVKQNIKAIEKSEGKENSKTIEKGQKDETDIWILIKGSRGMKMETIVAALTELLT